MVLRAIPVIRAVERIELPSTKHLTIAARLALFSAFILNVMLDIIQIVKHNLQYGGYPRTGLSPLRYFSRGKWRVISDIRNLVPDLFR